MTGITVASADIEAVTGTALDDAQFAALDRIVRQLLRLGYTGNPDIAEGRTADVLNAVYMSVAVRLITNPTGARSVGLGSANVTYGGSDADVANAFTLTDSERRDLRGLRKKAPSYISLGYPPPIQTVNGQVLPYAYPYSDYIAPVTQP